MPVSVDYRTLKHYIVQESDRRIAATTEKIDDILSADWFDKEYREMLARERAAAEKSDPYCRKAAMDTLRKKYLQHLEVERHFHFEKTVSQVIGDEYAGLFLEIYAGVEPVSKWPTANLTAEGWQPTL